MPLYDLNGAKPIKGFKSRRGGKRTLGDPGTLPAGLSPYGNAGGGGFAAAKINRLTMNLFGRNVSADQDIFGDSLRLRARARKLAVDNALFAKFLAEMEQNIVGEHGIHFQAKGCEVWFFFKVAEAPTVLLLITDSGSQLPS